MVPSQGDLAITNYTEAVLVVTSGEVREHYWHWVAKGLGYNQVVYIA